MKDNNVYRKMDNGRYVPVGIYCGDDFQMKLRKNVSEEWKKKESSK